MKKLFLSLAMGIALLFAANGETKAQSALLVQGGYSWSEGIISAGYQYKGISSTIGWMQAPMPGDGSSVAGVVWNIKWGPEWDESGYYFSYAYNSVGYREQHSYNGGGWTDDYVEGMNILSVGYKVGSDVFYLSADCGWGFSPSGSGFSWGITAGIPLFGTY